MMDDELNSFEIKSEPLYDPDPLEVDPLAPRPSDYLHAEEGAPSVSLFHFKPVRLEDERKPSIINENLDSNDEDISPVKREPGVTEFKIENGWNPSTFDEDHIPNNENNFPKKRKVDAKEFDEDSSSSSVICVENSIKIEEESSGYSDEDGNMAVDMLEDNVMEKYCPSNKNVSDVSVIPTVIDELVVGSRTNGVMASGKPTEQNFNREKRFSCRICDYITNTLYNFETHIQTVHKGNKHGCDLCNFQCSSISTLMRHEKIVHDGAKNHCCNICDYKARTKYYLKAHEQSVHLGIKPFVCKDCDYKTSVKGNLKRHVATVHKALKLRTCKVCGYNSAGNLLVCLCTP